MAERGPTAHTRYTSVAQHAIRVWIGPGAQDLESTVAHGFVKHGFKVLLHCVVDGPLQAAWFKDPRAFTPGIPVYLSTKFQQSRKGLPAAARRPSGPAGIPYWLTLFYLSSVSQFERILCQTMVACYL